MKILSLVLPITIFMTGCSSISTDTYMSMYEDDCIPYLNSVIDRKVGDDTSVEKRAKWEDIILKDYQIAKDENNSEGVRKKAIKQASMNCDVQRRFGI
ncbi:MAG: hypothetical protein ACI843_000963 [Psychrobacter glaciei]|jgi:hypothetical protein